MRGMGVNVNLHCKNSGIADVASGSERHFRSSVLMSASRPISTVQETSARSVMCQTATLISLFDHLVRA